MVKIKHILVLLLGLTLFACSSENEQKSKQEAIVKVKKDSTVTFISFNEQQSLNIIQTFQISTSKKQIIKGEQGTEITIPKNCFGDKQENVTIELIECYSIQDMMFNNLSTQTTDDKFLESDGMICLNALSEKGDILKVQQGKLKIQMPTEQRKNDIQIFEGVENENSIVWELINAELLENNHSSEDVEVKGFSITKQISNSPSQMIDSLTKQKKKSKLILDNKVKDENLVNYIFNVSKMGWINCDRYIEGETEDLFVSVSEEQENVSLYLVLDKLNSNVLPRNPKAVNGQFEFANIPLNESFTLVALAMKGEEIYFGMANYSSDDGTIDCPELKPVTRQELTDILFEKFGKNIWNRPVA